jgi:hypothetical protein
LHTVNQLTLQIIFFLENDGSSTRCWRRSSPNRRRG